MRNPSNPASPRAFRPDRPSGAHPTTPSTVEAFISDQLDHYRPATAHNRYRSLQAFFKWAVEEEMIVASRMERMKPPIVEELLSPMLADDQIRTLLRVCSQDRTFAGRRDEAIIRVLLDSGARRAEIAALRWIPDSPETNDIDLDARQLRVLGNGRRERIVVIGREAVRALDRYLRYRDGGSRYGKSLRPHHSAHLPNLWLGPKGAFTESGMGQMIHDRGVAAGLGNHVHPHMFSPDLRPQDVGRGHERDRPDDACRLALTDDGLALRCVGRR